MKNQYVVSIGDPFNGLTLYGPFDDYDEALGWAERWADGMEWNIVIVQQRTAYEADIAAA